MTLASDFFSDSNYAEAGLWCVMGLAIFLFGKTSKITLRGRLLSAIVLVAFGISDVVEAQTGAWWRPWWLLVWKGICIAIMLPATILYLIRIKKPNHRDIARGDFSDVT